MILLDWEFVDSGPEGDYENPSGWTGPDAATTDVIFKCVVCCISAYHKLKPLKRAAIDFQHVVDAVRDLEYEAVTTYLTDHVKCSE